MAAAPRHAATATSRQPSPRTSAATTALTEAQLQLVRSAAGLTVLREALDAKALNGERIDVAEYCRISNSLRRLLSTIGLQRIPKDITPSASEYVAQRAAQARMEAAE